MRIVKRKLTWEGGGGLLRDPRPNVLHVGAGEFLLRLPSRSLNCLARFKSSLRQGLGEMDEKQEWFMVRLPVPGHSPLSARSLEPRSYRQWFTPFRVKAAPPYGGLSTRSAR
jgi:hypothetical protein